MKGPQLTTIMWQGPTGQTYHVSLDAALRAQHSSPNTVTDHPVETGGNVADHIRPDPDTVSIEGVISNAPVFLPTDHNGGATETSQTVAADWRGLDNRSSVRGAESTIGDIVPISPLVNGIPIGMADEAQIGRDVPGGRKTATVKTYTAEFNRASECYAELLKLRNDGVLCSVQTPRRLYSDMAMTALTVDEEPNTGDALHFTVEFKHVRFGATRNEPVPAIPRKKADKGRVSKVETPEAESEADESKSSLFYKTLH